MIQINKKLTPYNYTAMTNKKNQYIVIHYVGSESSAKNNADYFANNKLQSSAHYFVDSTSIWQSVEDKDKAWHCGGGLQGSGGHSFYQKCTNSNSIGIEMCCFKDSADRWFFTAATVKNTIDLVRHLMDKYNIHIENVIRHYDVTGKQCPAPYIDKNEWANFKKKIAERDELTMAQYEELKKQIEELKNSREKVFHYWTDLENTYYYKSIKELYDAGKFRGKSASDLNLPESMARVLTILHESKVI